MRFHGIHKAGGIAVDRPGQVCGLARGLRAGLAGGLLALALAGCTTKQYSQQADNDAYKVIAQKQDVAFGTTQPFTINYTPFPAGAADDKPMLNGQPIPMGDQPQRVLSLDECLELACRNSRPFASRKEILYIAALNLANARHQWSLFSGPLTANANTAATGDGGANHSAGGHTGLSFAQQFANGGAASLGAGMNLASDLLGMNSSSLGSALSASFTQPLLQGAWRGLAYESLYRQERDLAFAVLDYQRFTQTFSVTVATRYYQVLQQLDELENERASIKRLEQTLALTRALVQGGQRPRLEQDQAEQNLLNAQVRFTSDTQRYQDSLDNYKLTLGLPIQATIALDAQELQALNERGPAPLAVEESQAVEMAFHARPDVLTQRASLRDAERNVEIAADKFIPGVDLLLNSGVPSTPQRDALNLQFGQHTRGMGLGLNYPLDQTNNRDAYRRAQISQSQTQRAYTEFLDRVRLDVRQAYRQLVQAKESYDLQLRSLTVAQRRRKLANEERKAGLASARDVLDAEDALREAQNGVTAALVTYETTRINFLTTLGLIDVDENGKIHERNEPFRFDRLEGRYSGAGQQPS